MKQILTEIRSAILVRDNPFDGDGGMGARPGAAVVSIVPERLPAAAPPASEAAREPAPRAEKHADPSVYLTRDGDGQGPGGPLPPQFITSDLYARVGLAKAVDANLYLAIHGNGASVPFLSGPETWFCGRHKDGAANEKLARLVQQAMMDALHE